MSNYPGALSGGFVSHRFQSLKSDQPDLSLVNPTNWNQSHIIGSGAIQSGALGASMVNSGNITALAVTSGAIASGATSWNLFGPSKPFVIVTPNGPTDGGDYGPNTVGTTTAGIQEAVNAAGVNGYVKVVGQLPSFTGAVTITSALMGNGIFDFEGATLQYGGTGTCITVSLSTNTNHFIFRGGLIKAVGSAISSATAVALSWTGYDARIDFDIESFQAGTGILFPNGSNTNSCHFGKIKIYDTLKAIDALGTADISSNLWDYIDIRIFSSSVVGAVGFHAGASTGTSYIEIGNLNYNDYSGSASTMLKLDNFNSTMVIHEIGTEENSTTLFTLFNISSTAAFPSSRIIVGAVSLSPIGSPPATTIVTGNSINIISTRGDVGAIRTREPYPSALWTTGSFQGATVATVSGGRITNTSFQISQPNSGATFQSEMQANSLYPQPGTVYDVGFAAMMNNLSGLVAFYVHTFDKTGAGQATPNTIAFQPPAINTWYYVRLPATANIPFTAATGALHLNSPNVPSGLVINLAEIETFGPTSRPRLPIGILTSGLGFNSGAATIGLGYNSGDVLIASKDYVVAGADCYVVSSGGTGVSITVKDAAGTTIAGPLTTLSQIIPQYYKVNWGAFAGVPGVTISVQ